MVATAARCHTVVWVLEGAYSIARPSVVDRVLHSEIGVRIRCRGGGGDNDIVIVNGIVLHQLRHDVESHSLSLTEGD